MRILLKLMKSILWAVSCIVSILVLWMLIHTGITMYEKNHYKEAGEMVTVDGKEMHVYVTGKGAHTIVLMSGLGTAAPSLDFEPLIEQMKPDFKIVVVEGFGYGYSDQTSKPRTVENIVEELRSALKQARVEGPYMLMPHSISGIYAAYYANRYPKEVSGIIGLDCVLPRMLSYFDEKILNEPAYMSFLAPLGIIRAATVVNPGRYLPDCKADTYRKETLAEIKAVTSWNACNKDIVMETNAIEENVKATYDIQWNKNLPVLIFMKKEKTAAEEEKKEAFYQTYLKDLDEQKLVVLDGSHFLHWNCSKEIGKVVKEWLSDK